MPDWGNTSRPNNKCSLPVMPPENSTIRMGSKLAGMLVFTVFSPPRRQSPGCGAGCPAAGAALGLPCRNDTVIEAITRATST